MFIVSKGGVLNFGLIVTLILILSSIRNIFLIHFYTNEDNINLKFKIQDDLYFYEMNPGSISQSSLRPLPAPFWFDLHAHMLVSTFRAFFTGIGAILLLCAKASVSQLIKADVDPETFHNKGKPSYVA